MNGVVQRRELNMPPRLTVSPHQTYEEVVARFRKCQDPDEKLKWQAVMLKMDGWRTADIAEVCKHREDWVRCTIRAYNKHGPSGLIDHRSRNGKKRLLSGEEQERLRQALQQLPPDGGVWDSPRVAQWIRENTDVTSIAVRSALKYMRRLGLSRQTPRPKHPDADEAAQEGFKKGVFQKA